MIIDKKGRCLVSWHVEKLDSLFFRVFNPILHYGGDDLSICLSLIKAFKTLSNFADEEDKSTIQRHAELVVKVLADNCQDPLEVHFVEARLSEGIHCLSIPSKLPKN